MPRIASVSDDDEPLEDKTAALTLRNKRTERMQRKRATREKKRDAIVAFVKLPTELILECLKYLQPSDVFRLSFVNRRLSSLVNANASVIGDAIIRDRYTILAQCLPPPLLLSQVTPAIRPLLTESNRQQQLGIHKRPYQHIQAPDAQQLCTCLTCILTWNNLCLVLDFAHWQDNLDTGKPVPMIERGQAPEWNVELIARSARIVRHAVENSLWHARILELHLDSTTRSVRRLGKIKGNKRIHVAMTAEDAASGTDSFLYKHGPSSLEFPYHRDEYYLLEAYLPMRWWRKSQSCWLYTIKGSHDRDLELVQRLANRDELAQLTHMMSCIDQDNWMTDVLVFKMSMSTREVEKATAVKPILKYYAAVV